MIKHLNVIFILSLVLVNVQFCIGQDTLKVGKNAILFHINYGFHVPGADLAKRFGTNFSIGSNVEFKFRNNFFTGVSYSYLYGKKIKEQIGANLLNNKSEIVGADNHLAGLTISERGFTSSLYFGKIFHPWFGKKGGIKVSIGGGILQHKIRIVDDYTVVPQIFGPYLKGYDRLTNGLLTQQYIGYQYLSDNRRINFSVGFILQQGFTKSSRGFNYDTQEYDLSDRFDLLNGIQASWILPFYFKDYSEEIIY